MAAQFFQRVCGILNDEKITFDKEVVAAVVSKHFPDNRRILNELQRYAAGGVIDKGILASVSDVRLNELISALKGKDFGAARKWVTNNLDNDPSRIFRGMYDGLYEQLQPNSVPQLVLILAKYQYQAAFVADHEINLIACLTEIMVECEFK
jgi:replication factor C small subunit